MKEFCMRPEGQIQDPVRSPQQAALCKCMVLTYANTKNVFRRLGVPEKMCRLEQKNPTLIKIV